MPQATFRFRALSALFAFVATACLMPCAAAETAAQCAAQPDAALRLACYDALFRKPAAAPTPPAANESAEAPTAPAPNAPPAKHLPPAIPPPAPGLAVRPCDPAAEDPSSADSPMSALWELRCDQKRGTFLVKTYLPNFVLPVHVTSAINRSPSSPTQATASTRPGLRSLEAKLQISLRAKVAEGLVLPDGDLWFAYTQRSMWQIWDPQDSRPFRGTDYQPEAIYVLRTPPALRDLPDGWHWRMLQLGIAHQSNGQSDPLSRSWNRIYAGVVFERGDVGLQVRAMRRIGAGHDDNNPDVTRYIGGAEVVATWFPGVATAALTWRTGSAFDRGHVQLDWTFPVQRTQPLGLRWYAQLFSGYGETLLDYNYRQTSFGFGLTLFQF